MEIKHNLQNSIGEFFIEGESAHIGRLVYSLEQADTMVIQHTEVNKEFEGKGIAKKLVEKAVSHARNEKLRVVAQCTYAARVIQRDPSLQDVL